MIDTKHSSRLNNMPGHKGCRMNSKRFHRNLYVTRSVQSSKVHMMLIDVVVVGFCKSTFTDSYHKYRNSSICLEKLKYRVRVSFQDMAQGCIVITSVVKVD